MAMAGDMISLAPIPVLVAAAANDVAFRRVPNWLPGCVVAFGLVERAAAGELLTSVLFAGVTFGVLFLFWMFRWMGGADVKLLPACLLLVPAGSMLTLLLAVSLAGGVLSLVYLPGRLRRAWAAWTGAARTAARLSAVPASCLRRVFRIEGWHIRRGGPVPYACAISIGCAFILVTG